MSGLPLNAQMTALGGRFLRAARTAPGYRLYALGDRPGLVRARGRCGAIEGEVWALPTAAIGALLAQVPPPLGFGTVALADGPCLGFLAEAAGGGRCAGHHRGMAAGAPGCERNRGLTDGRRGLSTP